MTLERAGVRRLILANAHGGNYVLSNIVQEANVGERRMSLFPSRADWESARVEAGVTTSAHGDMHAGELGVLLLLHVAPDLVGAEHADGDWPASERPYLLVLRTDGYSKTGVIGWPSLGTAEKGRSALASLVESFRGHLALLDPESAM